MNKWIIALAIGIFVSPVFAQEQDNPPEETPAPSMEAAEPEISSETVESTENTPVSEPSPTEAEVTDVQEEPEVKAPIFVVILPERIDHDWYWFLYTDKSQHIVQGAVEKALIRAGLDVIDLNTVTFPAFGNDIQKLQTVGFAVQAGKQLKADYVISGQATAVKASEGNAYGVNVIRTQAEVTAKIIRISDGKILAIEDASILDGGQSAQAAGQNALKKAGAQVAAKIARTARALAEPKATAP